MNDVVPDGTGAWLARCECGATSRHVGQEPAWQWVLGHPCVPAAPLGSPRQPLRTR